MREDENSFLSVMNGRIGTPSPIWLMRQAGRYLPEYRTLRAEAGSFWAMCMDPELAAEVTLQPVRRFGFDAAILFSDILVVPYAMGRDVRFDDGPSLQQVTCVDDLRADEGLWGKRLEPVYRTISRVKADLPREVALVGFAGAPWTLATYMIAGRGGDEQRAAKLWGYRDPASFRELLRRVADCVAFHLIRQIEAGVQAVQLFDSWASGLPARAYEDWVIAPTQRIVTAVRSVHPRAKIIGFPRASTLQGYLTYTGETGVNAVSLDTAVPMQWAADKLPPEIVLQGNLDPVVLVVGGDALQRAVEDILSAVHGRPFIFNLGHGVLPETPVAHVAELLRLVRAAR